MKRIPSRARRIELALWFLGVALLGIACGGMLARWSYQRREARAFEAVRRSAPVVRAPRAPRGVVPAAPPRVVESARPSPIVSTPAKPAAIAGKKEVAETAKPVQRAAVKKRPPVATTARLEIPRLDLSVIVKEGADARTLARAVGHVPGTAGVGEPGNAVLAGHRDTFFRPLRDIRVNDRIRVTVPPNTYEYRVKSLRVVDPEETSVLRSNGVEQLTLVTCYPFRYIGPAPQRFIVSAERVN